MIIYKKEVNYDLFAFDLVHVMERYSNLWEADSLLDRCLALGDGETVEQAPRPEARRLKDKLDEMERRAIVADYVSGVATIAALAERYGVSDYSIRMILRRAGIGPKRRTITPEQTARVLTLWATGLSVNAIAKQVGMGQANVRLIVAGLS
jgi:transposase-like protein